MMAVVSNLCKTGTVCDGQGWLVKRTILLLNTTHNATIIDNTGFRTRQRAVDRVEDTLGDSGLGGCRDNATSKLTALGNRRNHPRLNIGLDLLFIGPLGMGTDGGALATVTAQCVSAAVCLQEVLRLPELRPARPDWRPGKDVDHR